MALRSLRLAALTLHLTLALDPFYLSPEQIAQLQGAAISMSVPGMAEGCTGLNQDPTDVEMDFAANAYWKYFTYDTYDPRTWVTLGDLETCLRSVPGGDVNEWVGAPDLWEAMTLIFKQLGDTAQPNHWWKQSWFEHNPVKNSDTVLGSAPGATAPISSMSTEAWEQQPCNAFSNAAFFEISLQACKTASTQHFGDFSGTWPWKNEIIAAGALMAYGSFAMHGNPSSGNWHEASGSIHKNVSRDLPYDTSMMDRVSMDVLFFVFFQAIVRAVARDPTDTEALKPVLGLLKSDDLAPLGCDNMYCDARDSIHLYQKTLAGPTSEWYKIDDMRYGIPNYELSSVGLVLVAIRAIMSDDLFGSAGMSAYTGVCSALVLSLMPNKDEAVWAEANYCKPGTDWYNSMKDLKWRVVKDIAKSLATLVTILESLVEGMFWQETLVGPTGYLDPYLKGVVNVSACWRQTHGNWHRVAAQMMKELMEFITTDVYTTSVTQISEAQKQQAWSSLNLVVAEFKIFVNALKTMKAANEVNLCRVFKLAKEVAASGKPLNYTVLPMMDADGINWLMAKEMTARDPILNLDLNINEADKDPTGGCNYNLENAVIDEISGFSKWKMEDVAVQGEYVAGNSFDETMVKFKMGLKSCPLHLKVKARGDFVKDGGKLGFICKRLVWRTTTEINIAIRLSDMIVWSQAHFQKLFAGDATALTAGVDLLNIEIIKAEVTEFDITNFPGERALSNLVNSLMKGRVLEEGEKQLSDNVKASLQRALNDAMAEVGKKVSVSTERRRLATCDAYDAVLVDSARHASLLLPVLGVFLTLVTS